MNEENLEKLAGSYWRQKCLCVGPPCVRPNLSAVVKDADNQISLIWITTIRCISCGQEWEWVP